MASWGRSPKGARYAAGALDFITAYILPEDIWYIIPFAEITSKSTVHLDPSSDRNRYRPYREAWHLLRGQTPLAPVRSRNKLRQPPEAAVECAAHGVSRGQGAIRN